MERRKFSLEDLSFSFHKWKLSKEVFLSLLFLLPWSRTNMIYLLQGWRKTRQWYTSLCKEIVRNQKCYIHNFDKSAFLKLKGVDPSLSLARGTSLSVLFHSNNITLLCILKEVICRYTISL